MTDILFLRPDLLWILILPGVLILILLYSCFRRKMNQCIRPEMEPYLMKSSNKTLTFVLRLLPLLGLAAAIIALAGPARERISGPEKEQETAKALSLIVNIPGSLSGAEMSKMKAGVYQLLDSLGDERISLMVQSGSVHTVIPFTNDQRLIRDYVSYLSPQILPAKGDCIDLLSAAVKSPGDDTFHAAVYITPYAGPEKAGAWRNLELEADASYLLTFRDQKTSDAPDLFYMEEGVRGFAGLIAQINSRAGIKAMEIKRADTTQWEDLGAKWAVPAVLLLSLLFIKRKNVLYTLLFCPVLTSCDYSSQMVNEAQVNYFLLKGDTLKAMDRITDPFRKGQLAVALNDMPLAVEAFAADSSAESGYNLGLALLSQGDYVESLTIFRDLKTRKPEWTFLDKNITTIQEFLLYMEKKKDSSEKHEADSDSDSFERDGDPGGQLDFEIWADKLENEQDEQMRRRKETTDRKSELIFQQIENKNEDFLQKRLQHEYSDQSKSRVLD